MRYRTRLLLALLGLALITNLVSTGVLYYKARQDLFAQMNSTALSIASSVAARTDAAVHESVTGRADESRPEYRSLVQSFRAVRDSNRRDDTYVKYLYSFRRTSDGTGLEYVIDAEEEGEDRSRPGDPYIFDEMDKYPPDFEKPQVLPVLVKDQYGTWLSATAPILDSSGRSVGAVGVDISAADVVGRLRGILLGGAISLVASLGLAAALAYFIAGRVTRPLDDVASAARLIGGGDLTIHLETDRNDEFGDLALAMNDMVLGLRQRNNLKSTLVRYVSKEVADEILASGNLPNLVSERRKVTILFADIRGFTTLAESMEPEELVMLLNRYFDRMIDVVFRHGGYLNKFIGDGLMVMFGAPVDDIRQEEHAVRAALDMCAEVEQLQEEYARASGAALKVAIGVNTGMAIVGNIGSEQKMEYTAIGDAVNTASRLESTAKELDLPVVVSEYTYVAVRNLFSFQRIGEVQLKGKSDLVAAFTVAEKGQPLVVDED